MSIHRILLRYLRNRNLDLESPPGSSAEWKDILSHISSVIDEMEQRKISFEHTLEVSLKEMERLHLELKKSSESQLNEQRLFLETIVESLPVAVYCKDSRDDFRVTLWNRKAEQIFGLSREKVMGKNDFDLFSKEKANRNRARDIAVSASAEILVTPEEVITLPNKDSIIVRSSEIGVKDLSGRPKLLIGVLEDISEIKKMEAELDEHRAQGVHNAQLSALGEMAAGIAHEINNPLAIIVGKTSQLVRRIETGTTNNEDLKKDLGLISITADRIAKIIRGLRSFSRNSEHDPMVPSSLRLIVDECFMFSMARFVNNGIRVDIKGDMELIVECRPAQIGQVLLNLLNNAFDAIVGSTDPWVMLESVQNGDFISLRVLDSGPGIPKDLQLKIMQPFFTTKEVGKGTGVGLSISKRIMEEHGGRLLLDTQAPNTCFILQFPKESAKKKSPSLS